MGSNEEVRQHLPLAAAAPANTPSRMGRGRANMQRRAAAIGAEVSWQRVGQGTQLRLWLPRLQQLGGRTASAA